jgi:hypothetical protein
MAVSVICIESYLCIIGTELNKTETFKAQQSYKLLQLYLFLKKGIKHSYIDIVCSKIFLELSALSRS